MGTRQFNVASYLSSQALFKDMSAPELARMAAASSVKRLSRGDTLFQAGQRCEGLYLIVDGLVKIFAEVPSGHQKVIEVIGAGGCVSESLMFSDAPHAVNASALCDAHVLIVPKEVLVHEMEHNTGLAMRMVTDLSRRLNGLVRDIEAVTLHSGVKRVVDYLLRSPVVGHVKPSDTDVTVALPASKGTIASLLSVTPEHFSRILHDLQAHGLIAVQRRHIHILDAQALARYA